MGDKITEDFIWYTNLYEHVWTFDQEEDIRTQIRAYVDGVAGHEVKLIDANIVGHFKGLEYVANLTRPTIADVRELHEIIFHNCTLQNDCLPGIMRNTRSGYGFKIGNRYCPEPNEILYLLDSWQHFDADPYLRHIMFEHIHPFADGNGRVGRLLWAGEVGIPGVWEKYKNVTTYYDEFDKHDFNEMINP